jgi:hypothetical protein
MCQELYGRMDMTHREYQKIWIEQCEVTEGTRERFGVKDAIHYLVGEKFLNFLEESNRRAEFAEEVPKFAAKVKEIFEPHELAELPRYCSTSDLRRRTSIGHLTTSRTPSSSLAIWPWKRRRSS